jgi:hypothetical protein
MYTISLYPLPTIRLNIHNQCSNFKLTNRGFFSIGETWNGYSAWEIDAGSTLSIGFKPSLSVFEGILTYELQRRYAESSERFESTYIRLVVIWKYEGYKKLRACINLIEYGGAFHWNNAKLEEHFQRYVNRFSTYTGPIKDTWLMDDATTLITRLDLDFTQRDDKLNVTISESVENEHTRRPVWIDPKM